MKVGIIGAGIGGLASAIRLASLGLKVEVFEKNKHIGGKIEQIKQSGYTFDLGPSIFTEPENILELLEKNPTKHNISFEYQKMDTSFNYFFSNGKTFTAYVDREKLIHEFVNVLKEDKQKVTKYLKKINILDEQVSSYFLDNPNTFFSIFVKNPLKTLKVFSNINISLLVSTLAQWNKTFFKSPEANQIVNKFGTYVFSDSYKMPAIFSVIGNLELNKGIFYPKGGMQSIINTLVNVAKALGVIFHTNTEIVSLIKEKNSIKGLIDENNQQMDFDYVISNMDQYYTHKKLLGERPNDIQKQSKLGNSGVVFYWGIKKTYPELILHNSFFSNDYKQEFHQIFNEYKIPEDPTLYVNNTSFCEPTMAPKGCQNLFVMVNCPSIIDDNREQWIANARTKAIKKISKVLNDDFEKNIELEIVRSPSHFQQLTYANMGSIGGEHFNKLSSNFSRHKNKSSKYKNLFYVGGTVHPGSGIPLCLKSAKIIEQYLVN